MNRWDHGTITKVLSGVTGVALLICTPAYAVQYCNTPIVVKSGVNSPFVLSDNYETNSGPCFSLQSVNAVLDLNGHSITCTGSCSVGVEIPDNGIHYIPGGVRVIGNGGSIVGFDVGARRGSIEGVKFSGCEIAIVDPFTARHNVITNVPNGGAGITVNFPTLYPYSYFVSDVSDNYIELDSSSAQGGILAFHYPTDTTIDRNVIHKGCVGLYVDGATQPTSLQGNAILGGDSGFGCGPIAGYWASYDGNVCTGCPNTAPFSPATCQ